MTNRFVFFLVLLSLVQFRFAKADDEEILQGRQKNNYDILWNRLDSLEKKGLSRSALEVADQIFNLANKENNHAQLVKALIHRLKFQDYLEEDALIKNLLTLESEAKRSSFPVNPLLHSMLAEMYWRYYENNRYRFIQRSNVSGITHDDPSTWDLRKIVEVCTNHYSSSLESREESKRIAVNIYDEVIQKGNPSESRKFRPSLFDFLAHRALAFYSNTESGLTKPAVRFDINIVNYLSDAGSFVKTNITSPDTFSFPYRALLLYRELIAFHLSDTDPSALLDLDLKRLAFVHSSMDLNVKDSLFEKSLSNLANRYRTNPLCSEAFYQIATLYEAKGNQWNTATGEGERDALIKSIAYCDSAIASHPKSEGAVAAENMRIRLKLPSLSFETEKVNPMGRAFRLRLQYRNVKKVYL